MPVPSVLSPHPVSNALAFKTKSFFFGNIEPNSGIVREGGNVHFFDAVACALADVIRRAVLAEVA